MKSYCVYSWVTCSLQAVDLASLNDFSQVNGYIYEDFRKIVTSGSDVKFTWLFEILKTPFQCKSGISKMCIVAEAFSL